MDRHLFRGVLVTRLCVWSIFVFVIMVVFLNKFLFANLLRDLVLLLLQLLPLLQNQTIRQLLKLLPNSLLLLLENTKFLLYFLSLILLLSLV